MRSAQHRGAEHHFGLVAVDDDIVVHAGVDAVEENVCDILVRSMALICLPAITAASSVPLVRYTCRSGPSSVWKSDSMSLPSATVAVPLTFLPPMPVKVPVIDDIIGDDIDDPAAMDIDAVGADSESESPQALSVRATATIPAPTIPEKNLVCTMVTFSVEENAEVAAIGYGHERNRAQPGGTKHFSSVRTHRPGCAGDYRRHRERDGDDRGRRCGGADGGRRLPARGGLLGDRRRRRWPGRDKLAVQTPDVLVLDRMLPLVGGDVLCAEIRKNARTSW